MKNAKKVYLKELRDMLRDRRTRGSAFIGPFMTVFLMLFMFGFLADTLGKPKGQTIYFVQRADVKELANLFTQTGVTVKFVATPAEGEAKIHAGTAHVLLDTRGELAASLLKRKSLELDEYFDQTDEAAQISTRIIGQVVDKMNDSAVKAELTHAGIPAAFSQPIQVKERPIGNTKAANTMLIGILPYLLVLWAFYGGLGAVSEMVAGEKEKNTLETLLITPVGRTDIALGKLLALATLCGVSAFTSVLALVVAFALHLPMMKSLFATGLGLTPLALVVMAIVLIPTVLLFASVLLAVSTRARNVREAQSQLTLISMLFITPAMASQFIGYTEFGHAVWVGLIPVLNTATSIRQAMSGEWHSMMLLLTIGENALLGVIGLIFTVSLFKREEVLMRT
jgi:sodium transport system permease protein